MPRVCAHATPAMATVVFFDIEGSTATMARLEEEDWRDALEDARDLLDPRIDYIVDVVGEFGGTVARIQGDGVMAIFGAPKPLEKHWVGACAAALKVRAAGPYFLPVHPTCVTDNHEAWLKALRVLLAKVILLCPGD